MSDATLRRRMLETMEGALEQFGEPAAGDGKSLTWDDGDMLIVFRRAESGEFAVIAEYYRPEAYDDDDLSRGGLYLAPRMGSTRVHKEVTADSVDGLRERLETA